MNISAMQVASLMSVNGKLGQVAQQANGFKSAFDSILNPQNGLGETVTGEIDVNIMDLFNNILTILKSGSSGTGNSLELLNDSKLSEQQVADAMGISVDDFKEQFGTLMDELLSLLGNNPINVNQLKAIKDQMGSGEFIHATAKLLGVLANLPKESFKQLKPDMLQFAAKASKVVETLSQQMDLAKNDIKSLSILKENMETVITKLEQIINNDRPNQNTVLENAFNKILSQQQKVLDQGMSDSKLIAKPRMTQPLQNQIITSQTQVQDLGNQLVDQSISTNPVQMQQVSKIEQFVLQVNQESKPVNYEQFVKDFTNILGKSQFFKGDGTNKLLIKLYPEHLGSLRIEILQDKGALTARMIATTSAAKDILDSQLHQLKHAFTQQNIQVDKLDVVFGETEAQKFDQGDAEQQSFHDEQEKNKQNKEDKSKVLFSEVLNDSLIEEKI
ncbi:flagellar hook-length control protein FliK [Heyndrickxia oleronia]|uniref:Flagellar hook-length control protein FliK n=1 Tax=Heyndrickxia oleronia TaxID=38875 RepID=A0AAW6SSA2_9BACI|nr:flagellar hook-length control protein FliK [Heyndrickxia oleronia]MDH5161195.1 flagellar hook-length control protein FliK [Heyndrickxia oleronia]